MKPPILLVFWLALAVAACGRRESVTPPQVADLVAVPPDPTHLVGPPWQPPELAIPAPLTAMVSGPTSALVNSRVTLSVFATDGLGNAVSGAHVEWTAPFGTAYDLGTSTTDAGGWATVPCTPAVPGPIVVRCDVSTSYLVAPTQTHVIDAR